MAVSPAVDQNYGGTITFATSAFTCEITDWSYSGATREVIETTHLATTDANGTTQIGNRTYMGNDLVDGGELTVTMHFNPDKYPPIHAVPEVITLDFVGAANDAKWAFTGFMTSYNWEAPLDDKMSGQYVIKVAGPITITKDT
jgi:hypothetical protein